MWQPGKIVAVVAAALGLVAGSAAANPLETVLAPEERAKLDTFEGVSIDKADKVFASQDWPRAMAEYDAFIVQFPESKITPYAILRKGRALQNVEKRFEAIKVYQEVLDFFPDEVKYAAAALFRQGECHSQNGDAEKAMRAWAQLADDADYVKQPLGAFALNALADNLARQEKAEAAIKRFEQVAVEFRDTNGDAARAAIGRVVPYYVRTKPDIKRLRDFYVAARTFEAGPRAPGDDLATDGLFWLRVREQVRAHGQFTNLQRDEQQTYYRYWCEQLAGKMPADDGHQIDLAGFYRVLDGDDAAWVGRMDKQFADHQQAGNSARVIAWIKFYAGRQAKIEEYLQKLDFAKMPVGEILDLVRHFLGSNEPSLANNTFDKLRFDQMDDGTKGSICDWGTRDMARRACQAYKDQDAGRMRWLRYLHHLCQHGRGTPPDIAEGLAVAADLRKVPAFAGDATLLSANLLHWSGKYEEAIAAYRQADKPPQTLYDISDCLVKLGRLEPAVAQLREVENFFADQAPVAALRVAYLYRDAGVKEKFVRSLRGVLKKYPKSGQSSEAHQRLEEMGLPIGGGTDAEE
jgi:TolA-binding protein